jgi:nitrous oxidase accessory protein NosD
VATNILVVESEGVDVSENTVLDSQVGIFIDGNHASVSENHVFDSRVFDGIRIQGSECVVSRNKVKSAGEALIFILGNDNKVEHNALADAVIGILKSTGSLDNNFDHNSFDNVAMHIQDPPLNSLAGLVIPER